MCNPLAPWESLMDSMEPKRKAWMGSISNSSKFTFVEIRDSGRRPCSYGLPAGTVMENGERSDSGWSVVCQEQSWYNDQMISESRSDVSDSCDPHG